MILVLALLCVMKVFGKLVAWQSRQSEARGVCVCLLVAGSAAAVHLTCGSVAI